MSDAVAWHDVECGGYVEDLALWSALADAADGPVLEVGAGTGRVALHLARAGVDVVALDTEPELLAALAQRAGDLPVTCVVGDARRLRLAERFALVIVPMQTLQLLDGPVGRAAFLRGALAHLRPGGRVAVALADALEDYDATIDGPPEPDVAEIDGARFSSMPVAIVDEGARAAIHRMREVVAADGSRRQAADVVRLDRVSADEVADEAQALGFAVEAHRTIRQTAEYVGSTVAVLRAP